MENQGLFVVGSSRMRSHFLESGQQIFYTKKQPVVSINVSIHSEIRDDEL
jgi:hypothetical protein